MKIPNRLQTLIDEGFILRVVRQLMSGKEAQVFVVETHHGICCAKVYKESTHRNFHQAAEYTDNRRTKNSRQARAMAKKTTFGRQSQEEAWQKTEFDALKRLKDAEVSVPTPYDLIDGVLLMELVCDAEGHAAPRLQHLSFSAEEARHHHARLIQDIVNMLCAGIIHGDLSEYNILCGEQGLVIIDLPQIIDAAGNNHAPSFFARDVDNITHFFAQFAPELAHTQYAQEIWALYQQGLLYPHSELTGKFINDTRDINLQVVLIEIEAALEEERLKRERMTAVE